MQEKISVFKCEKLFGCTCESDSKFWSMGGKIPFRIYFASILNPYFSLTKSSVQNIQVGDHLFHWLKWQSLLADGHIRSL